MQPFAPSSNAPTPAESFAADVEYYLALDPRQLPSRYLYDALGSVLFEAICELPWYGVTRAEFGLLERHDAAILSQASTHNRLSRIVELGPGNGTKLRTLLEADAEALSNSRPYVLGDRRRRGREIHLIDVSGKALDQAVEAVSSLERVEVVRHEATYEDGLREIAESSDDAGSTLVLFLGSNIGNFDRPGTEEFLRIIRAALRPGDSLLLGADLVKPEKALLLAYDDPLGVTAAFNRNLLVRINRELGGDFELDGFRHRAVWNGEDSRVEMHLVSRRSQRVRIPAAHIDITLGEGDTIWTESSYKYDPAELSALLVDAGFEPIDSWTDTDARFSLLLVQAA